MTLFNQQRQIAFTLDLDGLRRGLYSDKYFENIQRMMSALDDQGYRFPGENPRFASDRVAGAEVANMPVEMQIFTRRSPYALIGGVDYALALLRHAAGSFDEQGEFIAAWPDLEVDAVQDGVVIPYNGTLKTVRPVLRIRGVYRQFALLETPILGALTRISRVATNVYRTLQAARGKSVLFFPARFDLYHTQAADGYAYHLAVERYNYDHDGSLRPFISTDAQGAWWAGSGGGTIPHAVIATFFGNTSEAMLQFAATQTPQTARIALVDFENDCVATSVQVLQAMFDRYRSLIDAGDSEQADRYKLFGVRLDTGGEMRDSSVEALGDPQLDFGVVPRLVTAVREALDHAWEGWNIPNDWRERAAAYCRDVRIAVTGGFTTEKIDLFERLGVPADIYGVGSSFFANGGAAKTDFSADLVRVKHNGEWLDMAKRGRGATDNPDLVRIPPDYAD
ncbi:MAG: nicotinate phosphoribosyltransferase [Chloroflexi bacterium]|nr:nicotinate phosphoribosyltransferase [Chloroflexota bacterium]